VSSSSQELALPGTGELVTLTDAASCAEALLRIRMLEGQLKHARGVLTERLVEESARLGTKTIPVGGGFNAVVSGGTQVTWDTEELEKLLDVGLPQERYDALVRMEVTVKVDARVAKQIADANPDYAVIIGRARQETEASYRVDVKR
jgi:hypothetical protein